MVYTRVLDVKKVVSVVEQMWQGIKQEVVVHGMRMFNVQYSGKRQTGSEWA